MSRLAATAGGSERLDAAEVVEMKGHLAFLRRYKDLLRLKLNAAEDLLVNGQREPSERGVCHHLLAKVDRSVIEAAVQREPLRSDTAARARMLAGAIRLTADVGVLLAYLETLAQVRSRAEAAAAFAEVVRRIDFESLSATRLVRLLQVLLATFVDHERVQVLFGLLATPAFRRAFDAAAAALPPEVADAFAPLRAVHRRLLEEPGAPDAPAVLARGMEQVLSAPDPVLRAYPEALRAGLLELALRPETPSALADRAAGALLATLPREGRSYPRLALRRAAHLLARHADDRARVVLEELHRARPDVSAGARWRTALDARRLGRVALAGELPARGRLAPAFWLDGQRGVWLRTAAAPEAERLASEARLQAALALPGVALVVEHGVASAIPYVAVSGPGKPLMLDGAPPFEIGRGLLLAAGAARILRTLALAGAALPDAAPERLLYAPPLTLVLADLDGVEERDPVTAAALHAPLAGALARALVSSAGARTLAPEMAATLARALAEPCELPHLINVLDRAALHAGHG
ncbi:MAG TPA: hypothetical protein VE997_02870 [Candidatus Limnocylindria bacterium]|nr:hypothetical protein [Candidatus Limnocylindria bacterium]